MGDEGRSGREGRGTCQCQSGAFAHCWQLLRVASIRSGGGETSEYSLALSEANIAKNRDLSRLPREWAGQGETGGGGANQCTLTCSGPQQSETRGQW